MTKVAYIALQCYNFKRLVLETFCWLILVACYKMQFHKINKEIILKVFKMLLIRIQPARAS